jgi:outer membrane biosynthesis protein TonB
MDRTEQAGLGVAVVGHVALFAALSLGLLATTPPIKPAHEAVEVQLVKDIALEQAAPVIAREPPAEARSPEPAQTAPPEPIAPPVAEQVPPEPAPIALPKPVAKPAPQPVAKVPAKAPPKPALVAKAPLRPEKHASRLNNSLVANLHDQPSAQPAANPRKSNLSRDLVRGLTDKPSPGKATAEPTAQASAQEVQALAAEVRRQLKPFWKAPTGTDAELLKTVLRISLARNGSVVATPEIISQTGDTESNRPQKQLHAERAIGAVRLAAPFKLPPQLYDAWKDMKISFDKRLSQ